MAGVDCDLSLYPLESKLTSVLTPHSEYLSCRLRRRLASILVYTVVGPVDVSFDYLRFLARLLLMCQPPI